MTNKNISGLTAATLPLVGTELIPLWDGAVRFGTRTASAGSYAATGGLKQKNRSYKSSACHEIPLSLLR